MNRLTSLRYEPPGQGFLLDTNVISETAQPRPNPNVHGWLQSQPRISLFVSVVSLGEIGYGIERLPQGKRRLDPERTPYRKSKRNRHQIAATAARHGLILATRNTKDFAPLGLQLTNPWVSSSG